MTPNTAFARSNFISCLLFLLVRNTFAGRPWCQDNPDPFNITIHGVTTDKNCEWIGGKDIRCAYEGACEQCPVLCDFCECKNNDEQFEVTHDQLGVVNRTCNWVKEDISTRCDGSYGGVVDNCPLYCGLCNLAQPSTVPTEQPSMTTSQLPSQTPSIMPFCPIEEFFGKVFYHRIAQGECIKIDLSPSGVIAVANGQVSTCEQTENITFSNLGLFNQTSMNSAFYSPVGKNGFSGRIAFKKGVGVPDEDTDLQAKSIELEFKTSNCFAPSLMPSAVPSHEPSVSPSESSAVPSSTPSARPTSYPTSTPSLTPSKFPSPLPTPIPSIVPSSTPTVTLSLAPSNIHSDMPSSIPTEIPQCLVDEFFGKAYYFEILSGLCMRLQLFVGGFLSTADSKSTSCSPLSPLSFDNISKYEGIVNNRAVYNGTDLGEDGWTGEFYFMRVPNINGIHMHVLEQNAYTQVLRAELLVSSCSSPSTVPSSVPSTLPTLLPTSIPTIPPTTTPSLVPTFDPSETPSTVPSAAPSSSPSAEPSSLPSSNPSLEPSMTPTLVLSAAPSSKPSSSPSSMPSTMPSKAPSLSPSSKPSLLPSTIPSLIPSLKPSASPSSNPTLAPSLTPSSTPTIEPSAAPSLLPSLIPSSIPTNLPSAAPTKEPSTAPSLLPSASPSSTPTSMPSHTPSFQPSAFPSLLPSLGPSSIPTSGPSFTPSITPSLSPSVSPSNTPSDEPTLAPSKQASLKPSSFPSASPTSTPSNAPSAIPTSTPTSSPTLFACSTDEFIGRVFYLSVPTFLFCLKVEMYSGGGLYVDSNSKNLACTSASTSDSTLSGPLSDFQSSTSDVISFSKSGAWSGTFIFRVDDTASEVDIRFFDIDTTARSFDAVLQTPTCLAPSATPSVNPTLVPSTTPVALPSAPPSSTPSATPSLDPTIVPSKRPTTIPSSMPSLLPSEVPSIFSSTEPSGNPTLLPRCSDQILGKTYFFYLSSFGACVKMDLFTGGVVALDPNNTSCSKDDTDPSQYLIVSAFNSATVNEVLFDGGYSGRFEVVQDGLEMRIQTLHLDTSLRTFDGRIQLPSCAAPSNMPSSTLSASPSFMPSSQPSVSPTVACQVAEPSYLGDGICDDDQPNYYTEKCLWDHGDCDVLNATYPNCPGPLSWLGDCVCDNDPKFGPDLNTTECGFDGGDCSYFNPNPNCTSTKNDNVIRRHSEQKEKWKKMLTKLVN